jgi:predicted ATPase
MLARPRTALAGRDPDLARVAALCDGGASIITLWGPPGIGKTRLALELCRAGALDRHGRPARTWFCDLTAARDAGDIRDAVCRGLGVAPAASATAFAAQLARCGPAVVVLDNFEQVAHHAADTVGAWAGSADDVCFLVTSRERLRLSGEVLHEVGPLGAEAAPLFVELAYGGAAPPPDVDHHAIDELVARLEGIPLAIELAAARVDVLGIGGLLAQLACPLDVLIGGARDADPHHETLRRAIDVSVELLSPAERRVYAQCAVFRGGFSLDDAAAVIEADPEVSVLDTLCALRDRALLRRVQEGDAPRFALYESIRAHAAEVLAAGGDRGTRARHARHYLVAAPSLSPADQGNLADAVAAALEAPSIPPDTAEALGRIDPASASDDLLALLERALDRPDLAPGVAARGHRVLGRALQLRGRTTLACAALERALELAAGDEHLAADLWADLGVLHHQLRDTERATACYRTALAIAERLGDPAAQARCLGNLGAVLHDVRRYDEALEVYRRALAAFRAAGEHRPEGIFLTNLAVLLQERGAFARARSTYDAALERLSLSGDRRLEAITRTNLGLLCHEVGELDAARRCHEQALGELRERVDVRSSALCLGRLGMALAALGQRAEAHACELRAERLVEAEGDGLAMGVLGLFRTLVALHEGAADDFVRDRLEEARVPAFAGGASLLDCSDDARTAARMIEAALARRATPARVLVVARGASSFVAPGRGPSDLAGRHLLRRLLARLVERHRDAPGEGLTLDELREAGWPDEHVLEASAVNRVHVALTELRRRGLKGCLVRRGGRYLLDPSLRVEISDG